MCVCVCVCGINRKSRVSYPSPGFLSGATWSSLPKKHYNGLNQIKPKCVYVCYNCTFIGKGRICFYHGNAIFDRPFNKHYIVNKFIYFY